VKYVIASTRWVLGQRFEITDDSGAPLFEARSSFGTFGTKLIAKDGSGREIMSVRKRLNGWAREVYVREEHVARVQRRGVIRAGWLIDADSGRISGEGNFDFGEYRLSKDGIQVATTVRQRHMKVKFSVDIDDYEDQVMFLAIILAMAQDLVSGDGG
jgi:uncharacterized protein YxjI